LQVGQGQRVTGFCGFGFAVEARGAVPLRLSSRVNSCITPTERMVMKSRVTL